MQKSISLCDLNPPARATAPLPSLFSNPRQSAIVFAFPANSALVDQIFSLPSAPIQIKVDQRDLLETMCVPRDDFLNVSASVYELCFDVVGVEKTKTKAAARKTNTNVMDNHR
jgi:hypothetical protein